MANFEIPENPEYSEEVRKFEEEDPGHADLFNAVVETLLGNEVFLKKLADSLAKRISGLDTLTKYTTVQTPNPSIGAQIVQKESETFDLDGNALPFPIQEVVAGHEKAISQLNTDSRKNLNILSIYGIAVSHGRLLGNAGVYHSGAIFKTPFNAEEITLTVKDCANLVQFGTCTIDATLPNIIASGEGRVDYTNVTSPGTYKINISSTFGHFYIGGNDYYKIENIFISRYS